MALVQRVRPPVRLEPNIRALVESAVVHALATIGEEEFFYIGERIEDKLATLATSSTYWISEDLWTLASALHQILSDHVAGTLRLPEADFQVVGVALHYLVNPFDFIPDHVTGDGYLDDAFVVNWCVDHLSRTHPALVPKYARRARRHRSKD